MDWQAFLTTLFHAWPLLLPVLFFFSTCTCCGASVTCGTGCSSTPSSITVTLTGFGNNSCSSCADYNATYILTRGGAPVPPCYFNVNPGKSCESNGTDQMDVTLSSSGGQTTGSLIFIINANSSPLDATSLSWADSTLGASPSDCKNLGTLTWPQTVVSSTARCTHDGSDAELTFA